jgi:hypothetical protein
MTTWLITVLSTVGILEACVLGWVLAVWRTSRAQRMRTLEERVAHLCDAMTLLSETAEGGFRAVALEVGRMNDALARLGTATVAAGAATSRRAVEDAAVDAQVSEGEMRLRRYLAEALPGAALSREPAARRGRTTRRKSAAAGVMGEV